MIREFLNTENQPALTSDLWHVVHAKWSADAEPPSFVREIVSEHRDSASALRSARRLKAELVRAMQSREKEAWDQVLVKRPSAESLKTAGRVLRQRR